MTEHKNRDFYRWTRDKQKAFEEQVQRANDSKLATAGGVLTGPIVFDLPPQQHFPETAITFKVKYKPTSTQYSWSIAISTLSSQLYFQDRGRNILAISSGLGLFSANPQDQSFTLGYYNAPWPNVYTKKLNNGADLELPTKAGKLALQSDIEDVLRKYNLIPQQEPEVPDDGTQE